MNQESIRLSPKSRMTTVQNLTILLMLLGSGVALPAQAVDRVRSGQWTGTTVVAGKTFPTSSCMSQSDADAMNGDAKSVKAYMETVIPPEVCKITDVKVDRDQVVYTATCGSHPSKVVTTSYHGDHSEGTDSTGGKTEAKRVGPCK
jgi:hypothetical protein